MLFRSWVLVAPLFASERGSRPIESPLGLNRVDSRSLANRYRLDRENAPLRVYKLYKALILSKREVLVEQHHAKSS